MDLRAEQEFEYLECLQADALKREKLEQQMMLEAIEKSRETEYEERLQKEKADLNNVRKKRLEAVEKKKIP